MSAAIAGGDAFINISKQYLRVMFVISLVFGVSKQTDTQGCAESLSLLNIGL